MKSAKSVEQYIADSSWQEPLTSLRTLLLETELEETLKWGAPVYTINGKNVIGLAGFKQHYGIWFFQGVFIDDKAKVLVNAQDGKTKGLRQWRFDADVSLDKDLIRDYVEQAIANQKAGKEIKPERNKAVVIPNILQQKLDSDDALNQAFNGLTPGKQREYCEHIDAAKREATKVSRLEKCVPMILDGKGLNDKYRC